MTEVFDAGALIAIDRGDRRLMAFVKNRKGRGLPAVTHGGVVAQVWRGGRGQASLAAALKRIDVRPIDHLLGRRAGALLALTGGSDVVDASLVCLVADGDRVHTADRDDIAELLAAARIDADVVGV